MKTKLPLIAVVAILVSACATGTYTAKTYDDDIYFSPGDVPPVTIVESTAPAKESSTQAKSHVAQDQKQEMSQPDQNVNIQADDMNNPNLMNSDTTVYYNDDDVKYVINNYYDDDMDYSSRINRFYNPFYSSYYDPFFYDDFYYGYGGYGGFGGYGGYWGFPSYGFSFGLGGYGGFPYYGYPGYGYGFGYPYYGYGGGYYGGFYPGGGYHNNNYDVARRRPTNENIAGKGLNNNLNISGRGSNLNSLNNANQAAVKDKSASGQNSWIENGHDRSRTINASSNIQDTKNATIVNDRRPATSVNAVTRNASTGSQVQGRSDSRTQMVRPGTVVSGNSRRSYEPSTTGSTYNQSRTVRQSQNYTPSYNKPRIVNQSNFNSTSYTRPRTSGVNAERPTVRSANSGSTYSQPRSSSSMRQTYQSSSTYSNGSSSSSPSRSSSSYSRSSESSGSSISAPSRSSSSYSGGGGGGGNSSGGGGGGSSSGSSSGGGSGGGSGHRR
jgi:hypothetical protein